MTPQEYAAAQAAITAAAAAYTAQFSQFMVNAVLTPAMWLGFLQLLYTDVERRRFESADLARRFYDSERLIHNPRLPRHDVYLVEYDFPTFVKNMEPTRKQLSAPQAPPQAVTNVVMHVAREVENAGRQQIIKGIEEDYKLLTEQPELFEPEVPQRVSVVEEVRSRVKVTFEESVSEERPKRDPVRERIEREIAESAGRPAKAEKSPPAKVTPSGPVRGWARVATGAETCAFCLMLISRGPVYLSAQGAGLDLHDAGAAAAVGNGEDVSEWMNEWHIGCDCKVIPVYDKLDWPGMDAAQRALELWIDASREADRVLADNPGKKSFVKGQWVPTTHNREAINSLRRRLERGEISTSEFAALAA